MSQENVEIVRSIYEAWAADRSAAPFIDRDLEYVNPPYAIEPGTGIGRHYLRKVTEIFPNVRFEIERYIDAGDDVVVIAKQFGRGSTSGVETETRMGYVWTVAEGKAIRFRWFSDAAEALEAVGLSEQDAHADS
jgi:ketosteroid isomerase-like protein